MRLIRASGSADGQVPPSRVGEGGAVALATFAVIGTVVLLVPSSALARNTNIFSFSFGAASSTPANPYPLSNPTDVAVDNSSGPSAHDIYVTDPANHRIEKFDSSGHFILMFGKDVNETTGGNVCTASSGNTCKAGDSGSSPGEFKTPTFVAVDGSSSPSAGDVYVGDTGDGRVSKFAPSGEIIETWGSSGQLNNFNPLYGIAVDQSGNLFVLTEGTTWYEQDGTHHSSFGYPRGTSAAGLAVDAEDHLYKADGSPEVTKFTDTGENLGEPDGTGAAVGLAVDPSTNDLYVDEAGASINHFGLNCGQDCTPQSNFGAGHLDNAEGLSIDGSTHTVDVANTGEGAVAAFAAVILPNVITGSAQEVGQTTATLTGKVEPAGGGEITSCHFEYGTTTAYSLGSIPCKPATPYAADTEVKAEVTGLTAETEYHFRLVAANASGPIEGLDATFTPHAVSGVCTEPETGLSRTGATLHGCFTGNGEDTHYFFEWGKTEGYGTKTPLEDAGEPIKGEHIAENFALSGLATETTYHYRFAAENKFGTTHGPDGSFTTYGAVEGLATQPATEIEADAVILNGSFSGNGEQTEYFFEWGSSESYGNETPVESAGAPPSGSVEKAFHLSGLKPFTTYDFRFVAKNATGTTRGDNQVFTTLGEYQFSGEFGNSGEGTLNRPLDVAVDSVTGDIYVADTGNHRIVKFDASGQFLATWGWGVSNGEAKSEVCTATCHPGLPGKGAGQFTTPTFVAVDNSGGPSTGDVYVADTADNVVQKFEPSGELVTSWGTGGATTYSEGIAGIAVTSSGALFVQPGSGTGIALNSFGEPVGAANGIAIDPSNDNLYEDTESTIEIRNAAGQAVDSVGEKVLKSGAGLGLNLTNKVLYAANTGANSVAVFSPTPTPDVTTGTAEAVTPSTATLTGHVDPAGGGPIGQCFFEYVDKSTFANEVQLVELSNATGGNFGLGFEGRTTGATGSGNLSAASGSGDTSIGSNEVTGLTTSEGAFAVGDVISGAGIAKGTTITGVETSKLILSEPASAAGSAVPLSAGSTIVSGFHPSSGNFIVGEEIAGSGIPPGTTITSVESEQLTLSGSATTTATGVQLSANLPSDASGGTVRSALEVFNVIGGGNIEVTGPPGGPYRIEFKRTLATTNVPQVTVNSTGLTPAGATATVETSTEGYGWGSAETANCSPAPPIAKPEDVSAEVSSLLPSHDYEYRLVATSVAGKGLPSYGRYLTLLPSQHLDPEISDTSYSEVTPTTVKLNAGIDAELSPTTYRFEYGPTPSYGLTTLAGGPVNSHVVGFNSDGTETGEVGRGEIGAAGGIAYSEYGGGTVYVGNNSIDQVNVYQHVPNGGPGDYRPLPPFGSEGSTPGKFKTMGGIGVEESTADVFVTDIGNRRIEKFEPRPDGTYELAAEVSGTGPHKAFVETEQVPQDVSVDNAPGATQGDLYIVIRNNERNRSVVDRFRPKPSEPKEYEYVCQFTGPGGGCKPDPEKEGGSPTPFIHADAIAVDANGNVYVGAEKQIYVFKENGSDAGSFGAFESTLTGVAVAGSTVYAASSNELFRLEISEVTHAVEGEKVIDREGSRRVTVNRAGDAFSIDQEELGEDANFHSERSGVEGLTPGMTYHFRVVAVNLNGATFGPDQTFNAPASPIVTGTGAADIGERAATLNAEIDPGFRATTYHFEYGLTIAYGTNTAESSSIGSDNVLHRVSSPLAGVRPESTYHYRVVATNEIGTTFGPDETFTTSVAKFEEEHPETAPATTAKACKHGFVKKHGKCVKRKNRVKRSSHRRAPHRRSHR